MSKLLLVFAGGGLGASCRFLLTTALAGKLGNFPLETLAANFFGSRRIRRGDSMTKLLLVFAGGGLGATCRFLLTTALAGKLGNFPLGTLAANFFGSRRI